jgi:3-keto-L-gulonate-6-phosphate decarboxylase
VERVVVKPDEMNAQDAAWICGFATALAEVQRRLDVSSVVVEVAIAGGLTMEKLRQADADPFDVEPLQKAGVR